VDGNLRVLFARLGVFELIVPGIKVPVVLHVPFLHVALIELEESDAVSVRGPVEPFGEGELFLVDPVGGPVDDLVHLPICGDRSLLPTLQILYIDVVLPDEGHLGSIGGEMGQPLLAFGRVAQRGQFLRSDIVDVGIGFSGAAINGLFFALDQEFLFVRAELVLVQGNGFFFSLRDQFRSFKNGLHFVPALVFVFAKDPFPLLVPRDHTVMLPVLHRGTDADPCSHEFAAEPDLLVAELFILPFLGG